MPPPERSSDETPIIQNELDERSASQPAVPPPDEPKKPTNLAGRMGRWSAQHRKIAIFGWLAFVVVAFAAGIVSGTTKIEPATSGVGESGRVDKLLHEEFVQPAGESVLVESDTLTVKDPAFAAAVEDVVAKVSALDVVTNVRSPLDSENAGQIGQGGRAVLIDFDIRGDPDDATTKIDPVVAAVNDAQEAHPELFIGSFGVSADKEVEGAFMDDLKKAGLLSIPVTLIIPLVVFGALVAAGIPLLLALTAIIATFGLVALPSSLIPIDEVTYELILLIGLAVGVDYSMFYLKREREERAAGAARKRRSKRCGHLRPLGPDLGADRHHRHVRDVPRGHPGHVRLRHGHDPGGRGGNARVAHCPAGHAFLARRPGRPRTRPLRQPAAPPTAKAVSGARSWRPSCGGRSSPVVLAGGSCSRSRFPALQLRTIQPADRDVPAVLLDPDVQPHPGRLPRVRSRPASSSRRTTSPPRRCRRRSASSSGGRSPAGRCHEPITVDANEAGTIATVEIPVDGKGMDAASNEALATLQDDLVPSTVGALPAPRWGDRDDLAKRRTSTIS